MGVSDLRTSVAEISLFSKFEKPAGSHPRFSESQKLRAYDHLNSRLKDDAGCLDTYTSTTGCAVEKVEDDDQR